MRQYKEVGAPDADGWCEVVADQVENRGKENEIIRPLRYRTFGNTVGVTPVNWLLFMVKETAGSGAADALRKALPADAGKEDGPLEGHYGKWEYGQDLGARSASKQGVYEPIVPVPGVKGSKLNLVTGVVTIDGKVSAQYSRTDDQVIEGINRAIGTATSWGGTVSKQVEAGIDALLKAGKVTKNADGFLVKVGAPAEPAKKNGVAKR